MGNKLVIYLMAALLLSTAAIYFREGIEGLTELGSNSEGNSPENQQGELAGDSSSVRDSESNAGINMSSLTETVFFLAVGAAHVIVTIWLLAKKNSKAPCLVAVVGSLALIVLYVASRVVALPVVGIQDDVGVIDILSKVLQAGIVIAGVYLLRTDTISPVKRQVAK